MRFAVDRSLLEHDDAWCRNVRCWFRGFHKAKSSLINGLELGELVDHPPLSTADSVKVRPLSTRGSSAQLHASGCTIHAGGRCETAVNSWAVLLMLNEIFLWGQTGISIFCSSFLGGDKMEDKFAWSSYICHECGRLRRWQQAGSSQGDASVEPGIQNWMSFQLSLDRCCDHGNFMASPWGCQSRASTSQRHKFGILMIGRTTSSPSGELAWMPERFPASPGSGVG